MSAAVLHEILSELGRGDEVAVAERLKASAGDLAALLSDLPGDDARLTDERVAELLDVTSDACESFLTIAFPTVEYAQAAALAQLPRVLRYVTYATAAARTDQRARLIAAVPAVGRVTWALAAFALHCDRPQTLVTLATARVDVPFSDETRPVIALTNLRYPEALDGNAGKAFRNYYEWLAGLGLLDHYALFRHDLDAAFLEADLVLAMYAGRFGDGVYARGHENATARRFVARVADEMQAEQLSQLFTGDGSLEERLERAYSAVRGDQRGFDSGPRQLFSGDR